MDQPATASRSQTAATVIEISPQIWIHEHEIQIRAIRAQGAGGQHVNKVATAIHLQFDIPRSSLPDAIKTRLLRSGDHRISAKGVLTIKAQNHRTQALNKKNAIQRLTKLLRSALHSPKRRVKTRPGPAVKRRRRELKRRHAALKNSRRRPNIDRD